MERKLRFLEKEIKKDDIPILDTGENPEAPQPREMIDMEVRMHYPRTQLLTEYVPDKRRNSFRLAGNV